MTSLAAYPWKFIVRWVCPVCETPYASKPVDAGVHGCPHCGQVKLG